MFPAVQVESAGVTTGPASATCRSTCFPIGQARVGGSTTANDAQTYGSQKNHRSEKDKKNPIFIFAGASSPLKKYLMALAFIIVAVSTAVGHNRPPFGATAESSGFLRVVSTTYGSQPLIALGSGTVHQISVVHAGSVPLISAKPNTTNHWPCPYGDVVYGHSAFPDRPCKAVLTSWWPPHATTTWPWIIRMRPGAYGVCEHPIRIHRENTHSRCDS